jgi:hypothetical protein
MEVRGAEQIVEFLQGMSREAKIAATFAVGAMAETAKRKCQKTIGLTDHSLADLAKLDHPYAKRHGPEGSGLHEPYEAVHVQDGDLYNGLNVEAPVATAQGAQSAVRNSDPKDPWIQYGTTKMIARPYMDYVRTTYADEILSAGRSEFENRLSKK